MKKGYNEILKKYKNKAGAYYQDTKKIADLMTEATQKAQKNSGPLDEIWNKLQLMFGLIKDWRNGSYKEVPKGSILAIIAGLLYFVSPIDLIPDVIPGLGLTDDVVILGLIIRQVSSDLDKYKAWKEGNGENTGDF
ncbi:MAG: YkvA family protein [Anaerovoracaceae bacterium]|jgi:uncharacterized membrane protein YkvA (DUF1232 family)